MELAGRFAWSSQDGGLFEWLILQKPEDRLRGRRGLACSGGSHKVWISIHDEEISVHWVVLWEPRLVKGAFFRFLINNFAPVSNFGHQSRKCDTQSRWRNSWTGFSYLLSGRKTIPTISCWPPWIILQTFTNRKPELHVPPPAFSLHHVLRHSFEEYKDCFDNNYREGRVKPNLAWSWAHRLGLQCLLH